MGVHQLRSKEVIAEEVSEKYPHFRTYAQCQNRAFTLGSLTFLAMASGIYIAQELMRSKLPFGRNGFLLAPVFLGCLSGYFITQHNTRLCQQMWVSLEEKQPVTTSESEKLTQDSH
ncbi:Hypothetical predicted protein [Octopus vulgaris]|uniref:Uncharacterized protein n=2 Tax=Octopus TaxID=6643 RepID=A0AA36F076_OCTVU|nr:uncharacterized protein LOC115209775 [Octopus sinensis]CAI9719734.1 Hypothetical predicted protein [Octopus vulgaris]